MIFVTVGTHEQQFDRLVRCVDELKRDNIIEEELIIQTGFSNYEPKYATWQKLFPYYKMTEYTKAARIVITHGGPSSFCAVLQEGKIPIVVPRQKEFNEHVNDHQLKFCREVAKRNGNIIEVENIEELKSCIIDYNELTSKIEINHKSNNRKFMEDFTILVEQIMK